MADSFYSSHEFHSLHMWDIVKLWNIVFLLVVILLPYTFPRFFFTDLLIEDFWRWRSYGNDGVDQYDLEDQDNDNEFNANETDLPDIADEKADEDEFYEMKMNVEHANLPCRR